MPGPCSTPEPLRRHSCCRRRSSFPCGECCALFVAGDGVNAVGGGSVLRSVVVANVLLGAGSGGSSVCCFALCCVAVLVCGVSLVVLSAGGRG